MPPWSSATPATPRLSPPCTSQRRTTIRWSAKPRPGPSSKSSNGTSCMPTVDSLLAALSHPAAYPFPVEDVVVHHTHISMVFLAGDYVYKVKKPVRLGFLDFSDVQKR